MADDAFRPVKRALLSVHDKTGLVPFARALAAHGATLISTGGTAKVLGAAGLAVTEAASITKSPEMLDGRAKNRRPAVPAVLLARRRAARHAGAGAPPGGER